jgi:hypothetical protein
MFLIRFSCYISNQDNIFRNQDLSLFRRPAAVFAILLIFHLVFFAYPLLRICEWLGLTPTLTIVIFLPLFFSQIISRLLFRAAARKTLWLRYVADFYLGLSPFLLFSVLCSEVAMFFGDVSARFAALFSIGFAGSVGVFGFFSALIPRVRKIILKSHKVQRDFSFVQISDIHIGSRTGSFLEQLVRKISRLEPDFLCITGDFIDATGVSRSELMSLEKLQCPVYFSIGNHERYEDLDQILARLHSLGVRTLRTDFFRHGEGIQVIGIDDKDDSQQVKNELEKIKIDSGAYSILMYHRPIGFSDAASAGIDLMLSGHTHKGQIFPFNLVVSRVFHYVSGLHRLGDALLYVSQGTGTWGPVMRVGSYSEITFFEVKSEL